jgi:hypothetical protein
MDKTEVERLLTKLCEIAKTIRDIAKTAKKNRKSLRGGGFYPGKFHHELLLLAPVEAKVRSALLSLELNAEDVTAFDADFHVAWIVT